MVEVYIIMKNIDSFKRFVQAHEALTAAMSRRIRYEFLIVEVDGKRVFASPTQFIEDMEVIRNSVRFYRAKGHSVRVLKGEVDINIK